jgi:ABC-2 type transport system ATP-binding protein
MNQGKIVAQGVPADLVKALDGKVWSKTAAKSDLAELRTRHNVISERLTMGQVMIRVLADSQPGDDFTAAAADLEDVYFSTIRGGQSDAAAA